jgi:type VI protein secretion system component VasF
MSKSSLGAFTKYGGMAFQLFGSCFAGLYFGRWLDARLQVERPTWVVFMTVIFMLASLYLLYKQLLNDK